MVPHQKILLVFWVSAFGPILGGQSERRALLRVDPSANAWLLAWVETRSETNQALPTEAALLLPIRSSSVPEGRACSQFENRCRHRWHPQVSLSSLLYQTKSHGLHCGLSTQPSYPEGNFGGNQLLGASIGLSPLCRTWATRFARQNSDQLPPQFPVASLWHGKVQRLSGPLDLACTQNPVHWTSGLAVPSSDSRPIWKPFGFVAFTTHFSFQFAPLHSTMPTG